MMWVIVLHWHTCVNMSGQLTHACVQMCYIGTHVLTSVGG